MPIKYTCLTTKLCFLFFSISVEGFESPTASQGTPSQLPPDHAQQPAQGSNPTGPQPPTNTIEPSPNPGNFHSESTPQNPSSPSSYQSQFQPSFIPQSARPQVPSFQPLGFQPGAGYQRNVKAPEGPYYPQWSTSNQKSQSYLQATSLTSASLPTFLPMPVPPSSSYQQVISWALRVPT